MQLAEALLGGTFKIVRREMGGPDLGRNKHIVAPDPGRVQALADFAFVLIDLRGVDVAVTEPHRLLDQTGAGAPAQLPGPQPYRRNLCAVGLDGPHRRVLTRSRAIMSARDRDANIANRVFTRRSALDRKPMPQTPSLARGQSQRAARAQARAASACPAPNCGWSPRARRAERRIRAGSASPGGAGHAPQEMAPESLERRGPPRRRSTAARAGTHIRHEALRSARPL